MHGPMDVKLCSFVVKIINVHLDYLTCLQFKQTERQYSENFVCSNEREFVWQHSIQ